MYKLDLVRKGEIVIKCLITPNEKPELNNWVNTPIPRSSGGAERSYSQRHK